MLRLVLRNTSCGRRQCFARARPWVQLMKFSFSNSPRVSPARWCCAARRALERTFVFCCSVRQHRRGHKALCFSLSIRFVSRLVLNNEYFARSIKFCFSASVTRSVLSNLQWRRWREASLSKTRWLSFVVDLRRAFSCRPEAEIA